jgi:hypothetical protein
MISEQYPILSNVLPTYELVLSSIEEIMIETGKAKNERVHNAFAEGKKKIVKYWKLMDDTLSYSIAVGNLILYPSCCCTDNLLNLDSSGSTSEALLFPKISR